MGLLTPPVSACMLASLILISDLHFATSAMLSTCLYTALQKRHEGNGELQVVAKTKKRKRVSDVLADLLFDKGYLNACR